MSEAPSAVVWQDVDHVTGRTSDHVDNLLNVGVKRGAIEHEVMSGVNNFCDDEASSPNVNPNVVTGAE